MVSDSYAVRTMRWGGVIVLLFIIYHLLHFTVGVDAALFTEVKHCSTETCFVRENVIRGFQQPFISVFHDCTGCTRSSLDPWRLELVSQAPLDSHLSSGCVLVFLRWLSVA